MVGYVIPLLFYGKLTIILKVIIFLIGLIKMLKDKGKSGIYCWTSPSGKQYVGVNNC